MQPASGAYEGTASRTLWLLFALFIVYGTTIPFRFTADRDAVTTKLSTLTLNPFVSPQTGRRVSIPDTVQNVMLFLPFGVLGMAAGKRRSRSTVGRVILVTVLGAVLSATVEALQLFTIDRVASFADVATNTAGALLGAVIAEQWRRRSVQHVRRLSAAGLVDGNAFYPAMVAVLMVMVASWQPFDIALDVGHIGSTLRSLWRDPWQVGAFRDEGSAMVQYALLAAALGGWLHGLGVRRAARHATAMAIALAIGLEATQLVIASHVPGAIDALVRVVGVLAGAALWSARRHMRGSAWWLALLIVATAASVATEMLSPFDVAETRRPFGWLPFMGYYESNWFPTVSHANELMLLYFPLGFCVGWVVRRPRAAVAMVLSVTLLVCVPVEYLQGWIVGRFPDITDVAFSIAGAWLGVWTSTRGVDAFVKKVAAVRPNRQDLTAEYRISA